MRHWIRPALVVAFSGFLLGGAVVCALIGLASPADAQAFAAGSAAWLKGIPSGFYDLLMALGVAYFGARSFDKHTETKQAQADAVNRFVDRGAEQ